MITSLSQLDPNGSYTYADYLTWKFEEYVELIKGRVFQMAAPSRAHQGVISNLHFALRTFFINHPCKVYPAPFDVRLKRLNKATNQEIITVVQPDICVVCDKEKLDDRGCIGAPDLVIEVLSPGNTKKEMRQKYEVYEESGVKEYWLVNLTDKTVLIYRLNDDGKFIGLQPLTDDDFLTTPLFEGMNIPVQNIFED
jgi:Uma2 family endonuclease